MPDKTQPPIEIIKSPNRTRTASARLIDGKLVVRSSQADDADPNRKAVATEWTRWVGEIEKRKAPGATTDDNPFGPKKP